MVPSHGSSNSGCARARSRRRTTSASCSLVNPSDSSPSNSLRFSSNHTARRCRSSGVRPRIALSSCSKLTAWKFSAKTSSLQRCNDLTLQRITWQSQISRRFRSQTNVEFAPMKITRQIVADKIADYLYGKVSQAELVDWAERAMMDADFDEADTELLTDIIGRLGLAAVAEFGLRWQDCEEFLRRLGYRAKVIVSTE